MLKQVLLCERKLVNNNYSKLIIFSVLSLCPFCACFVLMLCLFCAFVCFVLCPFCAVFVQFLCPFCAVFVQFCADVVPTLCLHFLTTFKESY
jgi:hypothetical protein